MLIFRKMKETDYDNVDAMMRELHALHVNSRPDMYRPLPHPYSFEEFCRRGASPDWICLYAEDGGKPVGLCFVELRRRTFMSDETSAYMHDIYVIPSSRRQHIGTMMYRIVEREARERGALRLDLCVWSFNEDALAFYRRMGLSPQRVVLEKDIREERFEHDCAHMQ